MSYVSDARRPKSERGQKFIYYIAFLFLFLCTRALSLALYYFPKEVCAESCCKLLTEVNIRGQITEDGAERWNFIFERDKPVAPATSSFELSFLGFKLCYISPQTKLSLLYILSATCLQFYLAKLLFVL